ncbi:hypothetical protein V2J09_005075 [Rumex salicifolius]
MVVCYGVTEDKMGAEAEVVCPQGVPVLEVLSRSPPQLDVNSPGEASEASTASTVLDFIPTICSGSFADIGPRNSMEDEHLRIDNLSLHLGSVFRFPNPSSFFVIFDGHGGPEAASYLKENAIRFFFQEAEFPQSSEVDEIFLQKVENTLRKAFLLADLALADEDTISTLSGTTALAALIFGRLLMVANAGDCRAVLCRKGEAIDMSRDHKPVCPFEKRRVEETGGFVDNGYLNGVLSLTRALGDWEMKLPRGSPSPLIPDPELRQIVLTEDDEFLIIACDGIWDVMSSQHAVNLVRLGLRRHNDPERCARDLAMAALRLETFDNLTAIVVCLTSRGDVVVEETTTSPPRWRPRFRCSEAILNMRSFPSGNDAC